MASMLPKVLPDNILRAISGSKKAIQKFKKVDPKSRYVLLFPNSNKVFINMGFNLLNIKPAEEVFDQANDLLKKDLRRICLNGTNSELMDSLETRNLATYVTSHATIAKLKHEKPDIIPLCKAAGGVGVGFVNSLVFSGAMKFEDGLDLVRRQSKAMEKVAKIVPTAKLRVHLRPATRVKRVCRAAVEHCIQLGIPEDIAKCSVSLQSSAHIVEIAGHEKAIKYLEKEGFETFEFRRMRRKVDIPQAYHTELMQPASDYIKAYIEHKITEDNDYLKEPVTCSVYSATAGCRLRALRDIKRDLSRYPVRPIQTEQLLHCLFARPTTLAQPNIFVLWDRSLLTNLSKVNLRAYRSAKLFD